MAQTIGTDHFYQPAPGRVHVAFRCASYPDLVRPWTMGNSPCGFSILQEFGPHSVIDI